MLDFSFTPTQEEYRAVVDEVILSTTDPAALDAFIGTYGAEILFGADLPDDPGNLPPDKLRSVEYATTEDYLLRVNLDAIDTAEFESWMTLLGFDGEYAFSSEEAVKLNAIIAKERLDDVEISYNPLSMLPPMDASVASSELPSASAAPASANCVMCSTQEYSKTATTYADGFSFSWLNDANLRATRAWQYYDLLELSPAPLPVLAMVDLGFALNADFDPPANIPQYDFMAEEYSHRQQVARHRHVGAGCGPAEQPVRHCWHRRADSLPVPLYPRVDAIRYRSRDSHRRLLGSRRGQRQCCDQCGQYVAPVCFDQGLGQGPERECHRAGHGGE